MTDLPRRYESVKMAYMAARSWGLSRNEFWSLTPKEFWWEWEMRNPKKWGSMTEFEVEKIYYAKPLKSRWTKRAKPGRVKPAP